MTGDKETRKPGQHRPESERMLNVLVSQELVDAAATCKVLWAKVKGHPYWPAQIMSNKAADEMMKGLTHSKEHIAPVQFFGTLEIAWMRDCDTVTWEKGMGSGYYQKGKSKRHFVTALEQVQTFLLRRKAPSGWWGKPPDKRVLPPAGASNITTRRASSMLAAGGGKKPNSKGKAAEDKAEVQQKRKRPAEAEVSAKKASGGSARDRSAEAQGTETGKVVEIRSAVAERTTRSARRAESLEATTPTGRKTRASLQGVVGMDARMEVEEPLPARRTRSGPAGGKPMETGEDQEGKDVQAEEENTEGTQEELHDITRRAAGGSSATPSHQGGGAEVVSSSTTSRPKTQAGEARAAPSGAAEEISGSFDSAATTSEEENTRLGGPEEQQVEDSPPPMIDKGNGNGGLSASLDSAATTSVQEEPQVIGSGQRANGVGREQQANLGVGANEHKVDPVADGSEATKESSSARPTEERSSEGCTTKAKAAGDDGLSVHDKAERTSRNGRVIKAPRKMGSVDLSAGADAPSGGHDAVMGVSGGRRDKEKEVEKGKNTEARSASEGKVVPGGKPSSMRRKIIQTPGISASLIRNHLLQRAGERRVTPFMDRPSSAPTLQDGGIEPSGTHSFHLGSKSDPGTAEVAADVPIKKKSLKQKLKELPSDCQISHEDLEAELDDLPKYEAIKRNIYLSKERPKRMAKSKIQVCSCKPVRDAAGTGLIGCHQDCLNSASFLTCDTRLCPCALYCANKPFYLRPLPKLRVFHTGDRGWGVKTVGGLKCGDFICEYVGEVIDWPECSKRMAEAKSEGAASAAFYIMELQPGLLIDARRKGNLARMLNSSCAPNAETRKWHDASTGETHIVILAKRDIQPGEEVTYDYQFEHYGLGDMVTNYKCLCGAPNCRGTMDRQPERCKDFGRRVEVWWEADGVYYRGTVRSYNPRTRKHVILYDDNEEERVNLQEVPHRWLEISAPMQPTPPELTELVQQPLQLDGQQHVYGKQNLDHDDAQKPLKVRKTVWVAQASHVGRPDGGSGGSTDVDHHARLSNNAQKSKKPMQRINATQQPEFHQKHPAKVKAEPATIHHHPAQPHAGDSSSEEEDAAKSLVSIFNTPPVKPTKPGTPPHQQPPAPLQCEQAEEATEVQMPQSQGHQERKGSATEEPSGSAKVELQDLSPAPSKSPTPQAASTPVRPTSEHSHLAQLQQPHPPPHTQHLRHSQPQTQHCISEASKHSYYEHPEPLPLSQQHLAGVMPPAVIPVAAMQAWPGSTHPPPGHHMGHNTTLAAAFGAFPHAQAQAAAAAQARAHAQAHAALQQHLLQQQIHAQVAALQAAGVPANQISAALQVGFLQAGTPGPAVLVPQGAMVLSTHPTAVGSQQLLQCPIQHCAMQMEALPKASMSPPSLPPPGGAAISSAAQERQQKPSLLHIPPGQRPSEECRDTSAFASSHKPGFQQPRRLLATGAAEPEGPPPSKPVHQAAAAPKASDRPVETRTIVETLAAAVRATDARRAAQKAQHPRPAQRQAKSNPQAAASEATAASSPLLASAGPHTTPASAGLCSAPEPPSQVPLALGKPPAQAESQRALSQQQASDTGNSTSATGVDEQRSRMGINPAGVSGNLLAADSAGDSNRTTSPGIPPATAQAHVAAQVAPSPARSAAGAAQANARADPQVPSPGNLDQNSKTQLPLGKSPDPESRTCEADDPQAEATEPVIIQAPETLANQQGVPGASDAILATERDPGTHPADEEVSGQPGAVSLGGSSDGSNALPPLP